MTNSDKLKLELQQISEFHMNRLPFHFALVSRDNRISFDDLRDMANILNKLTTEHVPKLWLRTNEVHAFPNDQAVPIGYAHAYCQDGLDEPGALGYHTTEHGQPVIYVDTQGGNAAKTLFTYGHEIPECMVDPYGNKLSVPTPHPLNPAQLVQYLIEVCDPNEAEQYGWLLDGSNVPDFIAPEYYDAARQDGVQYSYQGHVKAPRTLLPGGYASFRDSHGRWYQLTWFRGSAPKLSGPFNWTVRHGESLRTQSDRQALQTKREAAAA
jgi:hypothetical protein